MAICPDCGGDFEETDMPPHSYMGGSPGCWRVFNDVIAREFQDAAYFAAHRLTVDAYAAQHPGDLNDRRAVQSVNIHLAALCLIIEQDRAAAVPAMHKSLATHHKEKFRPLLKPESYAMTVKDVAEATSAADHCVRVREWAEDVWRANAANHDRARYLAGLASPSQ